MNVKTFADKVKLMNRPQMLDKDYSGACPCFSYSRTLKGKRIHIRGRCWRTSDYGQDLYVWGEFQPEELKLVGEAFKKMLDAQEWYGPYTLLIKHPS